MYKAISECGAVVRRVLDERTCENPAVTFPIKKKINTELFIHKTAAFSIGETGIRVVANEDDQPEVLADLRSA